MSRQRNQPKNKPQSNSTTENVERIFNVKLTVQERFVLREILPTEESYAGMTEIGKLKIHLALSGEEAQQIDLKQNDKGMVLWDPQKAVSIIKEIPMGEWMTNVIRDILREKNEKNKLQEREMSLYEKFIVDYGMV